jgi:hypothetical protein
MPTSRLFNVRFTFGRRQRPDAASLATARNDDGVEQSDDSTFNAAAYELLASLRGVRPERLRAIVTGQDHPHGGLMPQVALAASTARLRSR